MSQIQLSFSRRNLRTLASRAMRRWTPNIFRCGLGFLLEKRSEELWCRPPDPPHLTVAQRMQPFLARLRNVPWLLYPAKKNVGFNHHLLDILWISQEPVPQRPPWVLSIEEDVGFINNQSHDHFNSFWVWFGPESIPRVASIVKKTDSLHA